MSTNPLDVLGGLDDAAAYKAPCKVATAADMTGALIGLPVVDGYQTQSGDRVLVWQNADQTTNGIYIAQTGAWCRAEDFTNSSAVYNGTQVYVVHGAAYGQWVFSCQQDAPTIGVTPLTFINSLQEQAVIAAATVQAVWSSRAAFSGASILSSTSCVKVLGYATAGDGGEGVYSRLPAPPSPALAGNVQTADGAWWQLALGPLVPVESLGVFSIASDNTAALNAAIVYLQHFGGGRLGFRSLSYTFLGTILIGPPGGVSFVGASNANSVLYFGAGTGDCLTIGTAAPSSLTNGVRIENLKFDCSSRTGGRAIFAQNTFWSPIIRDVNFTNVWNGIEFYQTNTPSVDTVLVQGVNGSWAIYWHGSTTAQDAPALNLNNIVVNCMYRGADGMWWDGSAGTLNVCNVTFLDCHIGLWIKNTAESAAYVPSFGVFFNLVMDGMAWRALQIDGGREFYFTNCWLQNTSTPGAGAFPGAQGFGDAEAVYIAGDTSASYTSDIRFTGCRIGNTRERAVTISGARDVRFTDCLFEPGSKAGANLWDAVWIDTGSQDIHIFDSEFLTWGDPLYWRYGVAVNPGSYRVTVSNCRFYGTQTKAIYWGNVDYDSYCVGNTWQNGLPALPGRLVPGDDNITGSYTVAASKIVGGLYVIGGTPGSFTMTLPTAALIVGSVEDAFFGKTLDLTIINGTNGVCTIQAGAGVSFWGNESGASQFQMASATTRTFKLQFTDCASSAEAITVIG